MANPIHLPTVPWAQVSFMPVSPADVSMMEGRRSEMMASMTPYWVASYSTSSLLPVQSGLFDAFIMKADARGVPFLAYDPGRPRPIAMDKGVPLSGSKAGGGSFIGEAALDDILDSRTVQISGLPAAFKFLPGDYMEFRMTPLIRSLHRVAENATATSGGVATIEFMYALDTENFTTGATVHLEKASTVMMIDPGSVQAPKSLGNREASFSATEVFFS
ncbi:hypothetical protein MUO32_26595 [Shinella sp. CPCC 101442]|uniref:hypothetical protein n=1 Tax=Shinella sp. CPCC 101442 TaxID=2932265 RepID=UPI002153582B|nr:hypothetical protein [Shinella sp. CPCC 101442]MCR6502601.1 hypothetical protein [Shinella sp. CPCC 101442]